MITYSAVKGLATWVFIAVLGLNAHVSFAGDYNSLVLEQIKQMPRGRPLFGFACRKNPSPIFGTLRVRQIFHSPFAGLAEFLLGRNVSGIHQNDRGFARAWSTAVSIIPR